MTKSDQLKAMIKDTVIIFVITVVAGLLLGLVYSVTKEPIAAQKEKAKEEACKTVFTNADTFEETNDILEEVNAYLNECGYSKDRITVIYRALDNSKSQLGYVVTVESAEGYGGKITFSMGVTNDGVLNGISLLSISETPGLGMRAEEVLVPQFAEKQVDEFIVTKTGKTKDSEVDAITSATITSKAVTKGVNAGLECCRYLSAGGGSNE